MKTVIHAEIWLDVVIPWPKYWNQPRRHRSTASEYYVSLFIIGLLHGKSDTGPLICDSLMIRNTEELRARLCPDYVPVAPSRILPGALIDPGPRGCRPLWPNPLTTPSSFLFRYMLSHDGAHMHVIWKITIAVYSKGTTKPNHSIWNPVPQTSRL